MPDWFRRLPFVGRFAPPDEATPTDWSGSPVGARVLVEEEDASVRSAIVEALQDAGFQTAECAGPGRDGERRCPLVEGGSCDAVDHAAAVLQVFTPSHDEMAKVREAIHARSPDTPVVVMAPRTTADRHADLLVRTTVCSAPLTRRGVVTAVAGSIDPS